MVAKYRKEKAKGDYKDLKWFLILPEKLYIHQTDLI